MTKFSRENGYHLGLLNKSSHNEIKISEGAINLGDAKFSDQITLSDNVRMYGVRRAGQKND